MLKFDLGLFVKSLEELEGLPERLKKITVMVYKGRIDYDTFTFEEILEVFKKEGPAGGRSSGIRRPCWKTSGRRLLLSPTW